MCDFATNPKLQDLLSFFTCLLSGYIIPLIFAVAIVAFLWGVVQFVIMGQEDETKRTQGKQLMIWGIIALTVMIGVWGLVKVLATTFNLPNSVLPSYTPGATGSSGAGGAGVCPPGSSLVMMPGPGGSVIPTCV